MKEKLYTSLAASLQYPRPGWLLHLEQCRQLVTRCVPDAARRLDPLMQESGDRSDTDLQELFTQTFDHNPAHALEIGWHLFGEDYHRGALLVRLRQELRRHEIQEVSELPDHLSHVLQLLGRMEPSEALKFAQACVIPAMNKLTEGLQRDESPFLGLIECISAVIDHSCEHEFEEICDGCPVETA